MYRARYRRIVFFFGKIIASVLFWDVFIPKLGLSDWSERGRSYRREKSAIGFRKLAISMGGVMIKVGQFLSTRVDILPQEVTDVLAGLQDEVPPVSFDKIRTVIEAEFHQPLENQFLRFDPVPLAAASLGQVHHASIPQDNTTAKSAGGNGRVGTGSSVDVVVKVQRPDIENLIRTDLEAIRTVGNWLTYFKQIRRRANIPALLDEFSRILYEEIDYLAEGRNAEAFSANFSDDPRVRVPKVYWSYTTVRVLTLENVYAIKITDYEEISRANISRVEVASLLLDTYLQQIFEDGFFHADPHPGNLFIEPSPLPVNSSKNQDSFFNNFSRSQTLTSAGWQITFVDFGMVAHVPENLRAGLRELLIGVGTQDSPRVIRAYQQMGVLLPDADLVMLERAGSRIFEKYWGKSMEELTNVSTRDLKEFLDEFRELIYDLPFQIPQDIIFLVRCVSILSGICTGLDPQFNVFQHLIPYAQKIMLDEARNHRKDWFAEFETLARGWLNTPIKLDTLIAKLERGEISMRNPEVSQQINRLERSVRSLNTSLIFLAMLVSGVLLFLGDYPVGGTILLGLSVVLLFWLIWKNMTSV